MNQEYDQPTYINEEDGIDQSEPNKIRTKFIDSLFSANHRGAMIRKHGWSDAMLKGIVDELNFQYGRPEELIF